MATCHAVNPVGAGNDALLLTGGVVVVVGGGVVVVVGGGVVVVVVLVAGAGSRVAGAEASWSWSSTAG